MAATEKLSKSTPSIEYYISEALKGNGFDGLKEYLSENNSSKGVSSYNKQVLTDLDKLIQKEMDQKNFKNVALVLECIVHYGTFYSSTFSRLLNDGVVFKMAIWLQQAIELYTKEESSKSTVAVFFEHFFGAILMIAGFNKDGCAQVIGTLFYDLCSLVLNPLVSFCVQLDTIKNINMLLNRSNNFLKKQLINKEDIKLIMKVWGQHLPSAGDYELQVGLTEVLCRLTKAKERVQLSKHWFPMEFIVTAFNAIKDSDFETDCRKFLNTVNGILGEKRSVITFPCIAVYLEDYELKMPPDDKLENFWVDFNNVSHRISFFIADEDDTSQESLWETISLSEDMILEYSLEESRREEQVVIITLLIPVSSANKDGSKVTIHFDKSFDILSALENVFGKDKHKICGNGSSNAVVPLSDTRKRLTNVLDSRMQGEASQDVAKSYLSEPEMVEVRSRKRARMEKRVQSEGDHTPIHCMKQKQTSEKVSEPATLFNTQNFTCFKMSVPCMNIHRMSHEIMLTTSSADQDCNDAMVKYITAPEGRNVTATSNMLTETSQNSRTDIPKNNKQQAKETNIASVSGGATENKRKAAELPAKKIGQTNNLTLSPVIEECLSQASNAEKDLLPSVTKAGGMTENKTTEPTPSKTSDHDGTLTKEADAQSDQNRDVIRGSSPAHERPEDGNFPTSLDIDKLVQYQLEKSVRHLNGNRSDTLTEEKDTSSDQDHMKTTNVWSRQIQEVNRGHVVKNIKDRKGVEVSNAVPALPQQKWKQPVIADHSTSLEVEDERIVNKYTAKETSASVDSRKPPNMNSGIKAIAGRYNNRSKEISSKPTENISEFEKGFESREVPSKKPTQDSQGKRVGLTGSKEILQRSQVYDFNSGEEADLPEITVAGYSKRKSTLRVADKINSTRNISEKQLGKNVKKHCKSIFSEAESDALTNGKSDVSWIINWSEKKKPKLKGYSSNKIDVEGISFFKESSAQDTFLTSTISLPAIDKQGTHKKAPSVIANSKPSSHLTKTRKNSTGGGTDVKAAFNKSSVQGKRSKFQLRRPMDSTSSDDEWGSKKKRGTKRIAPQAKRPRRATATAKAYRDVSDSEIEKDDYVETEQNESASAKEITRETSSSKNSGNKSGEDESDVADSLSLKIPTSIEKLRRESYSPYGNVDIHNRPLTVSPMLPLAEKSSSLLSHSSGQGESPALSPVPPAKSLSNDSHVSPIAQELPEIVLGTVSQHVDVIDEALMLQTETSPETSPVLQQTFIPRLFQPSKLTSLNTPKEKYTYAPEPLLNTPPSTSAAKNIKNKQPRRADNISSNDTSSDEPSVDAERDDAVHHDDIAAWLKNFSTKIVTTTKEKYDKIAAYTKNSLRVTEFEVFKLWGQMRHRRIQRAEHMQKLLLDEMQTVTEETIILQDMENEMLNFWEKQEKDFVSFRTKQEERLKRMQSLFVGIQSESESEEKMMVEKGTQTLREELKVYQDRLFIESQRQQLNQVRHTLEAAIMNS